MKVLHVIPSIGYNRGGPSEVIRTMARCQAEQGLEVHVATTDDNGADRLGEGDIPTEKNITYWIFRRQARFYGVSFTLLSWLWNHCPNYDIIHIHAVFSFSSTVTALSARMARVPYVLLPHGILMRWGMHNRRRWLKRLSFLLIESRILAGAAAVQYTTDQELLDAQPLGVRHNALVIRYPVELVPFSGVRDVFRGEHSNLAGRLIVLFLSRLDSKKGLNLLLPAFAKVRISHPNTILVVAGDGDPVFVRGVKREADQLCLSDGIIWTGFLRGERKSAVLADADIFILPSFSENFCLAAVEAMAAGIPVIVSNQVGIHREIAMARAGLVVECTVKQIESALGKLLSSAQLRVSMGVNGVALAKQFSARISTTTLVDEYTRIAALNDR